jgi:hypothetical protein
MATQSLVSVIFEAANPIERATAVQLDSNGKLVPCNDASKFFGIATTNLEPDLATLRVAPTKGPLLVYHKGLAKATVVAGTYKKGQKLTVDSTHPGMLKPVTDPAEVAVAIATENATLDDAGLLQVFIL